MGRTLEQRSMHATFMAGTAAGDRDAFEHLYDEFANTVYSVAMAMLHDAGRAEDAAQDIWIRIWNSAGNFDAEQASVATWIGTIAHRHVIDLIRRETARPGDRTNFEPGDDIATRMASDADTERDGTNAVLIGSIREAMAGLPVGQRTALELAYFGGYTQSEIARQLGKPLGTIKTYMYQGMRRLAEQFGPSDPSIHEQSPDNDR